MNEKADNAIAVAATVATVAIPIPFADALLLIGEQVTLMATICGIYGMNIGKDGLKMLATMVLGAVYRRSGKFPYTLVLRSIFRDWV